MSREVMAAYAFRLLALGYWRVQPDFTAQALFSSEDVGG
jgi:hypothetical protein